jgi:bacterial/archaeal transporter family protein
MMWMWLALGSALALGLYDISKKSSLTGNAVWPVLFLCSATGALFLLPWLLLGRVESLTYWEHLQVLGKAALVTASWACTFSALKHLPLSISAPVRASAPLFTLFIAVSILGERPSFWQWLGIAITFCGYFIFSVAGKREGIRMHRNPWVGFMLLGTFLGALSGIYDKFLLQTCQLDAFAIQVWFSIYMAIQQAILAWIIWWPRRVIGNPFQWRYTILLVGLLLLVADRFYFLALKESGALISIISLVRRSNVIVSFAGGLFLLGEHRSKSKVFALSIICLGLLFLLAPLAT